MAIAAVVLFPGGSCLTGSAGAASAGRARLPPCPVTAVPGYRRARLPPCPTSPVLDSARAFVRLLPCSISPAALPEVAFVF
jgi:hypothetical protein